MAVEFKVPELGDGIDSADVLDVLVSPGDTINKEQGVVEVETDKATMEIPSSVAGIVKDVQVKKGESVKVGQVLITVDDNGGHDDGDKPAKKESGDAEKQDDADPSEGKAEGEKPPSESKSESKGDGSIVEFKVPELGDGVESADVLAVLVKPGDTIAREQGVIEAETDKATMEVPSSVAGTVKEVKVSQGDSVKPGQVLITVQTDGGDEAAAQAPDDEAPKSEKPAQADKEEEKPESKQPQESAQPKASAPGGPVAAAPSVRKFAREIGVDIHAVPGTGPGGRITTDDVKAYARSHPSTGAATVAPPGAAPEVTVEPMSKLRKVSAARLSESWAAPHVTLQADCDVTELEEVRQQFKKKAEAGGAKLTITAMFIKIASAALKVYPRMNASIDLEKGEFHLKNRYHVGCAVDTPRGLVVPVIRDVDKKNILQIAKELTEISAKARDGKLTPDEMKGGTFTVTNLGGLGIGFFTPVINAPEAAILGMGLAEMKPTWNGGEFEPKLMLPLSLSFDHRIVDGADGARFLKWLVDAVENPLLLSLEG